MVVARHMGSHALLALAAVLSLFAHQVEAASSSSPSLSFSSCVTACIKIESCETSDTKCICKGARSNLLTNVAVRMYYKCPDELRTFASSFAGPLASACQAIGKPIPQSKVDEADDTAELFADKLPPATTSSKAAAPAPTTTPARATPKTSAATSPSDTTKTTAVAATTTTTSSTSPSSSSSSSADDDDESTATTSSSATDEDGATTTATDDGAQATTSTTPARPTTSATRAVSQSSTSTKSAGRSGPTDSNPFDVNRNAGGRSTGSWALAGLPLVMAVAM